MNNPEGSEKLQPFMMLHIATFFVSVGNHYGNASADNKSLQAANKVTEHHETSTTTQKERDESTTPNSASDASTIEYEDKVQKELLEIINDFKNNVHSISQVEQLVEEWKNRNDVQKSFKEKQEQLKNMRLKYERIQQEMKNAMRKPTPFERVKKLFSRGKSREDKSDSLLQVSNSQPSVTVVSAQRPISSLSLQSTSSK